MISLMDRTYLYVIVHVIVLKGSSLFLFLQAQKHSFLELDLDVLKLLDPTQDLDPEMCAQDLVDFSPVYRCLHIHSVVVSTMMCVCISSKCLRSSIAILGKERIIYGGLSKPAQNASSFGH